MSHRIPLILAGLFLFVGCEKASSPKDRSSDALGSTPMDNGSTTDSPSENSGWTPAPVAPQIADASNAPPAGPTEASSATAVPVEPDEVLNRFVGVWDLSNTSKPAKWNPDGGEFIGLESTIWALQNRVILIRDLSQPGGRKGLYIATYDAEKLAYPFWCFDSNGLMGTKWELTWDASTHTANGRSADAAPDWTSSGQNHFPDTDTNLVTNWMRDETGELLMENAGKKTRLSSDREPAVVEAWKKHEPAADLPAELKVLDRMIGTWDTVAVQRPAGWTPGGGRSTAIVTREWILNGRFVMDTSMHSNGDESIAIIGYDPGQKAYRNWWFNSEGQRNDSRGHWNAASQTLSYRTELEDGISIQSSVRFADGNKEVWQFRATDTAGKLYLDMEITATRRIAAPAEAPASAGADQSDQEKLQGTWGAVTYVQDGQGEGEAPIAPEDSAIRFMFQGTDFLFLASGNAGATPKGSFKLGSSDKTKTIDLIFQAASNAANGPTMLGVYEIDGDTLKITYGPDGVIRPSDFKSAAGSKHIAIIFKRIRG